MRRIRRRGSDDVEPVLVCVVCQKPLGLRGDAWIAFKAVTVDQPQSEGPWLHKRCVNGQASRLFGAKRITLWRASDVLHRLLDTP